MSWRHILIACLLTLLHSLYVSCGNEEYFSYWEDFKRGIPREKHVRREPRSRGDISRFQGYNPNVEGNNLNRDISQFPVRPFRENFDDRVRNAKGPVLFPEQRISPSRSVINPFRPFPNRPRRPLTPPPWQPGYPERHIDYPRQPPTIPTFWETSSRPTSMSASTPEVPGMQTRRPPCEEACQTTPEYNPLCGTDNVTYNNMGRFNCAINCGKNITIDFRGACPVTVRGR